MIHETIIRVRLSETDTLGVVYYSNYFVYFDVARIEFLRDIGIDNEKLKSKGFKFFCLEARCNYLAPLRFDDLIKVKTWIEKIGEKSIVYRHLILKEEKKIAEGYIVDVLVDSEDRPVNIPQEWKEKLSKYLVTSSL